jgi:hypothetical protein
MGFLIRVLAEFCLVVWLGVLILTGGILAGLLLLAMLGLVGWATDRPDKSDPSAL